MMEEVKLSGICTVILRDRNKRIISIERRKNVITDIGKAHIAKLMGGLETAYFSYIQVGQGTTPPSPSDTSLESYYAEKRATVSFLSPSSLVFSAMFSFTETVTITEAGIFSGEAASSPIMLCRGVFEEKTVSPGQYLEISWKIGVV